MPCSYGFRPNRRAHDAMTETLSGTSPRKYTQLRAPVRTDSPDRRHASSDEHVRKMSQLIAHEVSRWHGSERTEETRVVLRVFVAVQVNARA